LEGILPKEKNHQKIFQRIQRYHQSNKFEHTETSCRRNEHLAASIQDVFTKHLNAVHGYYEQQPTFTTQFFSLFIPKTIFEKKMMGSKNQINLVNNTSNETDNSVPKENITKWSYYIKKLLKTIKILNF
jgi:hypothetical protein